MLMNRTTQQFDAYLRYMGVRVRDLLDAAGVDIEGVVGITVFAPLVELDVAPTSRVGVFGIGGLGHMALMFLKAWPCL